MKNRASLTVSFHFVFHAVLCRVTLVPQGLLFDFGDPFYMVFTCGTIKNNDTFRSQFLSRNFLASKFSNSETQPSNVWFPFNILQSRV